MIVSVYFLSKIIGQFICRKIGPCVCCPSNKNIFEVDIPSILQMEISTNSTQRTEKKLQVIYKDIIRD
jgi:hypothetical protein